MFVVSALAMCLVPSGSIDLSARLASSTFVFGPRSTPYFNLIGVQRKEEFPNLNVFRGMFLRSMPPRTSHPSRPILQRDRLLSIQTLSIYLNDISHPQATTHFSSQRVLLLSAAPHSNRISSPFMISPSILNQNSHISIQFPSPPPPHKRLLTSRRHPHTRSSLWPPACLPSSSLLLAPNSKSNISKIEYSKSNNSKSNIPNRIQPIFSDWNLSSTSRRGRRRTAPPLARESQRSFLRPSDSNSVEIKTPTLLPVTVFFLPFFLATQMCPLTHFSFSSFSLLGLDCCCCGETASSSLFALLGHTHTHSLSGDRATVSLLSLPTDDVDVRQLPRSPIHRESDSPPDLRGLPLRLSGTRSHHHAGPNTVGRF